MAMKEQPKLNYELFRDIKNKISFRIGKGGRSSALIK